MATTTTTTRPAAPKADVRDRLAAEMDAALGKGKAAPKAPGKAAPKAVTPAQAKAVTDTIAEVKRGTWADAIKAVKAAMATDTRKLNALDKARAVMLDSRCEVVRATAHAMTFPESHAKAGKTAGQPSQSVIAEALGINRLTFAPFFKAAGELHAKFPELVTEPGRAISEAEREHVASFWKSEALRAKQARDKAKAKAEAPKSGPVETIPGEGEGEGEGGTGAGAGTGGRTSDVTADTVMACMKLMADALEQMGKQKLGFTTEQGDAMQAALSEAQERVFALTVASK